MLKVRKRVKIFENTFHCTALYFYDLCLSIKVYFLLKKKAEITVKFKLQEKQI